MVHIIRSNVVHVTKLMRCIRSCAGYVVHTPYYTEYSVRSNECGAYYGGMMGA